MNGLVSIVCVTYNEERLIDKTIESFLAQDLNGLDLEIIVVDGNSEDSTRKKVEAYTKRFSNIRLVNNSERKNQFGRNIGVKESKGDYIAILGAHTIYAKDYVRVCIEEMQKTDSIGVSGKVITTIDSNSNEGQLCELILTNKFGVSGESFRTVKEGYTSMVNYPVFKKEIFEKIGLYNTTFHRNQDNDFNSRVIEAGFKLYNTWKTECRYYPSDTLVGIFSYAYKNGFWNGISLKLKPDTMMVHHYVPFIFVLTLLLLIATSVTGGFIKTYFPISLLFLVIALHFFTGFIFALGIKKHKTIKNILALPFLFFAFHISYGWGTLKGLLTKSS